MLYRVFSSCQNKENDFISKKIKEAFLDEKRVFVLVPEQGTALYERRVVSLCGNRASQRIEVTNFSRLPDIVLREYGALSKKAPTDAEKRLLLAECIHHLKPNLTTLNLKEDADFVKALEEDLSALKMAGLTPKAISDLEKQDLPIPELKEKLSHTALLSAAFSAAISSRFSDPMDEGERLANVLKEYPFFRESVVFIDGFWDFTHPQKLVLEEILKQAENVFITFEGNKKDPLLFSKPLLAARDVLQRANRNRLSVEDITPTSPEGESALSHLAKHFGKSDAQMDTVPENMELWECKNQGEEADFIAHRILKLVREGASFHEISILSRSGQGEEMLALTLAEKNIPYFLEESLPLCRTPLAKTVLLACRFAFGKGSVSDARFYIKNGAFPLEDSERFLLERYVSTWSLTPKKLMGSLPFTMHPEGYFDFKEKDREELSFINKIREKVFSPMRDFALAMAEGTVEERICAILAFLSRIGAEKMLFEEVEKAKKEEDFEKAASLLSVWNSLLEALCAFGKTLGETACDENRFLALLDLALSENLPRKLPPAQDRVQIGRVNFSRAENTKYVFITGLCAGTFPQSAPKGGVFADREKEVLRGFGFPLAGGENSIADEFFYFYQAALMGEKGLYLSYQREGSEISSSSLSVIGKRMLTLFPKLPYRVYDPEKEIPLTEKDAFSRLVKMKGSTEKESPLTEYFLKNEAWREKLLSAKAGKSFDGMRDTLLTEKPYKDQDINMVYSRLEKYTLCPFSYFARYLLGAKEQQKATLGANIAGSFVHSVLEKVLLNLQQKGLHIGKLGAEEIAKENRLGVESAIRELLGDSLPDSMNFLLLRLEESTLLILKHLQKEFSLSQFEPIFFEKSLGDLNDIYKIPLSDKTNLCLYGSIDRVDLYRKENGESFVRVVDYKTGGHDFSLTDVGNGLSLQMLLYLFALWNEGFRYNGENIHPLPAGVLYLNGLSSSFVCDTQKEVEKVVGDPFLSLSREGLLVDDRELLSAADPEGMGEFIPVAWGKERVSGKANLVSLEKLGRLKKKVEKDFATLAERLKAGDIAAKPLVNRSGTVDPCKYCEFFPVCKRKEEDIRPYRTRISQSEIFGEEE